MAPPLRFRDAAEWHRWLEDRHATEAAAHVLISKKSVPRGLHYEDALEEALCFGWIDGKLRSHDDASFVLRFSPRKAGSVWSESNRERVLRLIRAGRMTAAGQAKIDQAKESGAWAAARRPNQRPRMPADLGEALRASPEAWAHFRAWGDSFQTSYILWVTTAKQDATRRRRIARVVERATQNKRPGIEGP